MMNESQAIARVKLQAAAGVYPLLTDDEVSACLAIHQRGLVWQAETIYNVGDKILPTVPTGFIYVCQRNGESLTTEPSWPAYSSGSVYVGYRFTEGDSGLLWAVAGHAPPQMWDVRGAVREAWMLKAAKCSADLNISDRNAKIERQKVYDNCISMANKFVPVFVK